MIDKIWKSIQEASGALLEQADHLGKGAKEKAYQLIEEWVAIFPTLEKEGLEITSFSLGFSLNPTLEVEFKGLHEHFPMERLDALINKYRSETLVLSVFKTLKTTYRLHENTGSALEDPLILKIKIRLSPEIKVFLGEPIIQ